MEWGGGVVSSANERASVLIGDDDGSSGGVISEIRFSTRLPRNVLTVACVARGSPPQTLIRLLLVQRRNNNPLYPFRGLVLLLHVLLTHFLLSRKRDQRETGYRPITRRRYTFFSFLLSFSLSLSFSLCPSLLPSLSLSLSMLRRCLRGNSDCPDASSTRSPMESAVSTDFQNSLTTGRPLRGCDLFRTPLPPGRSVLSTDPLCAPSRPRCDRMDLVPEH